MLPKYDSLTEEVRNLLRFELICSETQYHNELADLPQSSTPQPSAAFPPTSPIVVHEDEIGKRLLLIYKCVIRYTCTYQY